MNSIPDALVAFYIFIVGLCIGSFLNVAILRGLSGEDFIFSRSKCPKCQNKLKWYMNIPLISYIFLRGRCAFCNEKISLQYPIVEFVCGVCFLCSYLAFGFSLKTFFLCIILSLFILLFVTDFKETVILDWHAYILAVVVFLYSVLDLSGITVLQSLSGAIFGFLFFEILSRIVKKLLNCRMFGEGDSLIAIGLGALFVIKIFLIMVLLSFLIQFLFLIPVLVFRCLKEKKNALAGSYTAVFFCLFIVFFLNYYDFVKNDIFYILVVSIVVMFLIWSLKNIVQEIIFKKNAQVEKNSDFENTKYYLLPFGPALIISAVLCIFLLPSIKNIIINFIS